VPEGGWPLPGPIPSSYYSREALPRPIGLTRALDRLELRAPSLRGLQIPHLGGRERLLAAAVAVAVLFLGGVIGLATRGSASTPHGQPPGPGRQAAAPAPTSTAQTIAPTALPTPTPTPATRTPAATFVTFVNAPLTAHRGSEVTLRVLTLPHTTCSITVGYPSAPQLPPHQSSADGTVAWSWHVNSFTKRGTWPVAVACGNGSGASQIIITGG